MFVWQIPEISRDRFKAAPVMKMFRAAFLNKPLRFPMDFKCHSFHSLPHLGSCSILSYLAFFWPFSLSANTQKSTHSCRHTLSHNSVWLKFRMLPFFKVCVSVYEWGLYESKQVHATSMHVEIRDNFSRDASLCLPCWGRVPLISAAVLHIQGRFSCLCLTSCLRCIPQCPAYLWITGIKLRLSGFCA